MSILPFVDPIGWNSFDVYGRRHYRWNPFREFSRIDREMERIQQELDPLTSGGLGLPTNELGGQVTYNDRGDLSLRCDTSGFRPEELRVDLDGDRLTVTGRHVEDRGDNQHYERFFTRSIQLDKNFDQRRIKCEMDSNGNLCVCVPRFESIEQQRQSIPISMRSDAEQARGEQQRIGGGQEPCREINA